jgi:LysR family transcriptional regulator, glycine cleavage system transcriptional activator
MVQKLPPLHALRAFEATARIGSVSKAADELCVTHSAVSHQLKQAEDWLGVKLFIRRAQGLELTTAGEEYRRDVCEAFSRMAAATSRIKRGGDTSAVNISSLPLFFQSWLLPKLQDFWVQHSEIDVVATYTRSIIDIEDDAADLSVRVGQDRTEWPNYRAHALLSSQEVPVCSQGFLDQNGPITSPEDLLSCHLLHDDITAHWERWFKAHDLSRDFNRTDDNAELFIDGNHSLAGAIAGEGIALMPRLLIIEHLKSHNLIPLFSPSEMSPPSHYFLLWRSGHAERRNATIFRDWLIAESEEYVKRFGD